MEQSRRLAGRELLAQRIEGLPLVVGEVGQPEERPAPLVDTFVVGGRNETLAFQRMEYRAVGLQQAPGHLALRQSAIGARRGDFEQRLVLLGRPPLQLFEHLVEPLSVEQVGRKGEVSFGAGAELLVDEALETVGRGFHERGQRRAHHLAERTHVVGGNPLPQLHLFGRQEGPCVEQPLHGLDALEIGPAVVHAPHDARVELAGAELHRHGPTRRYLRHAVGHGESVGGLRQRQHDVGEEGHPDGRGKGGAPLSCSRSRSPGRRPRPRSLST